MPARVGVILSGCGVFDGSEIHEAVAILVALDRRGATAICLAPNIPQAHVIDHRAGKPTGETRNVLIESARIARGKVLDLATVGEADFDAVIFPGGFGAAKNLSTFAFDGAQCTVNQDVEKLIRAMHAAGKPIGMACISPVIAARLFGPEGKGPTLTVGSDRATVAALTEMHAKHHETLPTEIYTDAEHRIVTTACYMNDVGPWTVFQGAEKMVEEVLRLSGDSASLIRSDLGAVYGSPLTPTDRARQIPASRT